jgi:hypothetical protein
MLFIDKAALLIYNLYKFIKRRSRGVNRGISQCGSAALVRERMVGENPRKSLLKLLLSFCKTLQALYCMA